MQISAKCMNIFFQKNVKSWIVLPWKFMRFVAIQENVYISNEHNYSVAIMKFIYWATSQNGTTIENLYNLEFNLVNLYVLNIEHFALCILQMTLINYHLIFHINIIWHRSTAYSISICKEYHFMHNWIRTQNELLTHSISATIRLIYFSYFIFPNEINLHLTYIKCINQTTAAFKWISNGTRSRLPDQLYVALLSICYIYYQHFVPLSEIISSSSYLSP